MAPPRRFRENSHLEGEQSQGWSAWKRAMVPPDSNGRNFKPRGPGQVGYRTSSIKTALGKLDALSQTMLFTLEVHVSVVILKNWGAE